MSTQPIDTFVFDDDGRTPNSRYPVIVYRGPAHVGEHSADAFDALFDSHGWRPQWRGGVYDYHHYHSNAHEALAVYAGEAELILGGESGRTVTVNAGDVLILPAGTGHCRVSASADFALTAAYPEGQGDWDLCRPGDTDHDTAAARIAAVALPEADPLTGSDGQLRQLWLD